MPAIAHAAERVGEDFAALLQVARLESGFNPSARARTSSATGLFQFIDSTWLAIIGRYGARHGISASGRAEALALRRDPQVASLMAAEFMAENRRALEGRLGRPASATDLYLAHFLGRSGAIRFLDALATEPGRAAADLFPAAAAANRAIFFVRGAPRSLAELHALFARRLGAADGTSPTADGPGSGTGVPAETRGHAAPPGRELRPAPAARPEIAPALAARLAIAALSAAAIAPGGAGEKAAALLPDAADLAATGLSRLELAALAPALVARAGDEGASGTVAADAARAAYLLLAGLGR